MSIQSEIADMYRLMLRKGASDYTAHCVASALCRELVPYSDEVTVGEAVSRAIVTGGTGPLYVKQRRRL